MTASPSPILIVGSMAFDDLELPSGAFKDVVGGSATYSAFAASVFAPVGVVAVVGDDFPDDIVTKLRARSVAVEGIERVKGKTFRWAGRYDADFSSRTTLDTQLNVFADFAPKLPESLKASSIVLLGNIHPALQLDVLAQVHAPKLVVADTMNFWIQGENATLRKLLAKVDTLVINDEEARELSGIHNVRKAAREVLKLGPKRLIVKRGEHGALLFDEAGIFAAPGYPLEHVVDPTGAGDSFAGGFIGYLAQTARTSPNGELSPLAYRRAMVFGTATASRCVEGIGTAKMHELGLGEVHTRVAEIRALYDFGAHTME